MRGFKRGGSADIPSRCAAPWTGVGVEVRIDLWSPRRVKLQRAAAPAVVVVMPYDPSWLETSWRLAVLRNTRQCRPVGCPGMLTARETHGFAASSVTAGVSWPSPPR
jgi:hypothetical protein